MDIKRRISMALDWFGDPVSPNDAGHVELALRAALAEIERLESENAKLHSVTVDNAKKCVAAVAAARREAVEQYKTPTGM